MGKQRTRSERAARAREFEDFVAGAAGRLLHVATLLTAETRIRNPYAQELLAAALAHAYAVRERGHDEDPYALTRDGLALRFARTARRHRTGRGGILGALTPTERLVLVLCLYEGVPEEQAGALLGLPEARVRAVCARAVARMRSRTGKGAAA
ncbi:sigma factor-like helix-turn-helix DNA-binding protein [Streptomyces filamentosus]|uniref:DNA-directed RNA polymerase sigma-70 factor n=1 Tax=Streptomyces filamentosus TaxID=67294 RepID=A0A919BEY4_STRFL|nr:sigma factor-like helix-turn-helix DNA-binding protein [Streptomyces filamentosus]KAA6219371.1 RNA polymerase [Streptomyces filamentosus]GHF87527.1 DNA-directed RNA polymerase sigma-70 factor [Streptomyces filamentosus]